MAEERKQQSVEEQNAAQTILVVEDDADVGTFLLEIMAQETDHQAFLATNGLAALQFIRYVRPALYILDYHLPDMNGVQLYDRLHAMRGFEATPAIMISANLPRSELEQRSLVGLNKPFELDEFLNAIERLLVRKQGT